MISLTLFVVRSQSMITPAKVTRLRVIAKRPARANMSPGNIQLMIPGITSKKVG